MSSRLVLTTVIVLSLIPDLIPGQSIMPPFTTVPYGEEEQLKVTDDGPGVVGFPITFTASYPAPVYQSFEYEFLDPQNKSRYKSVISRDSATAEFTYDRQDDYQLEVSVWLQVLGVRLIKIRSVVHKFNVSQHLSGLIRYSQVNTTQFSLNNSIVAADVPFDVTFHLHDPSGNFKDFKKSYEWLINGTKLPSESSINHTISDPGVYNLSLTVTASNGKDVQRFVTIEEKIVVKERIPDLHVDGKFFIFRNDTLELTISCGEISNKYSAPFFFCTELRNETFNSSSIECSPTTTRVRSNKCFFTFRWYFESIGKYYLIVQLWNDVSDKNERVELTVMPTSVVPTLSFVVIPVVSVIAVIITIFLSIAWHLQQRKRYTVEVADFDFRPDISDEDLVEKTFIQRLKDSYREETANGLWACCSRNRNHLLGANYDSDSLNDDLGYASTSVRS